MSFASYKARRSVDTSKLVDELNKIEPKNKTRSEDERFWKPTTDKVGNGYAVIRFLPSIESDNLAVPFITTYDHGFQGPSGKWYIENSLTTIGQNDPVSELNSKLWNTGEEGQETARKQKRRLHYIGNILVVKDPAKPENEGTVRLYKFGPKIYDKIKDAMNTTIDGEEQIIPYDMFEGANFKLKVRRNEHGFPNYDNSVFDSAAPISNDESELEAIFNKLHALKPFIDPEGKDHNNQPYFKSYDELKTKLYKVLEIEADLPVRKEETVSRSNFSNDKVKAQKEETPWVESSDEGDDSVDLGMKESANEDDETLAFFRQLAQE